MSKVEDQHYSKFSCFQVETFISKVLYWNFVEISLDAELWNRIILLWSGLALVSWGQLCTLPRLHVRFCFMDEQRSSVSSVQACPPSINKRLWTLIGRRLITIFSFIFVAIHVLCKVKFLLPIAEWSYTPGSFKVAVKYSKIVLTRSSNKWKKKLCDGALITTNLFQFMSESSITTTAFSYGVF